MMQRHCLLLAIGLSGSMLSVAAGQVAPPVPTPPAAAAPAPLKINDLPRELKLKPSLTPEDRQFIVKFVATAVEDLKSADPDKIKVSRESLIAGGFLPPPATISTDFAGAYAEAAAAPLQGVLAGAKDFRTRLNVAIAAARIAASTGSAKLEPVATALLKDNSPWVQLWGARAAKAMMPELIRIRGHQALMNLVLGALKANPSGVMVREAYEVLTPDPVAQQALPIVKKPLMDLTLQRIGQYKTGMPDAPGIDSRPATFLTQFGVWSALQPAEQTAVIQMICDLMCYGAIRADADPAHHDELAEMVETLALSLAVAADQANNPDAKTMVALARNSAATAKQKAGKLVVPVKQLVPQIEKVFKGVKIPPLP